ncbi:MAG: SBBP repeat-containing protein [Candidatus Cloacimonetes bacterium]|nr:SBBP repeat-containing protein [Candidatus Cloacimonadota bacterium]
MKTMFITLIIFLMVSFSLIAQAPEWQRVTKAGGSGHDCGYGITIDEVGNTYVTGSFEQTAIFGSYSLTCSCGTDIFVAKMDADGTWQWATKAAGTGYNRGYGITIDDAGYTYVTGSFENTATFGSYSFTSSGGADIFVAKLDADGTWQWATKAGGSDYDYGYGITIDDVGNTYVTGRFENTATFGTDSLTSNGENDIFVAKMDTDGTWQWANKAGGSGHDCGYGITIDDVGNTYLTGYFGQTAIFGFYSLTSSGGYDIFVAKIGTDGTWQWATKAGGSEYDFGLGITIDDAGNNYVTGRFENTATFGSNSLTSSGSEDIYVAKMDTDGTWQWASKAGGSNGDFGNGITIDDAGKIYVTGYFENTATFGTYSLTSSGWRDIYVAKIDTDGTWQWATRAGGSVQDYGYGITMDDVGNTYVTGCFSETATFGTDSLTSNGEDDIFVAKMGRDLVANFFANPTSGYLRLEVNFADLSTPRDSIISWYWDFGDGIDTTYTSYIDIITHIYQDIGTYNVSLTVTDINDSTNTELKIDYITIYEGNEVNGHAYLYNQANHIGIKVLFERFAPSIYKDSTYTNADGYYSIGLPDGIYNITYLKDNYYSQMLNEPIYSNTTLQEITLYTYILIPLNYPTIQEGINNCIEGDTVLVDIGNYLENIDFNGKSITVASKYLITQDTSYISQTIIDGNQNGSVATFENGEDYNTVLLGFTIKNGYGLGGGIYCSNSYPTIKHVTIIGNSAENEGGGIYCSSSSPTIKHVTITENSSAYDGGGISCYDNSSPSLENVTITGNSAENDGGGIYCSSSSSPTIINSIVSDNIGDYGIYVESGNPSITYSDFYNNDNGNFYNCGQWVGVNVTTNVNGDSCDAYSNIQLDPLFVDPDNGDYHLSWANFPTPDSTMSPCIDAGDLNSPLDPDGTRNDMGAYYFDQTVGVDDENNTLIETGLFQNYPNPFNKITTIRYFVPKYTEVKIEIYNIKGQLVETLVDAQKPAGYHTVELNAKDMSSGIYFYKLQTEKYSRIKKMIVLR